MDLHYLFPATAKRILSLAYTTSRASCWKQKNTLPARQQPAALDVRKYAAGAYYLRFNQPGVKSIAILKQ